MIRHQVGDKIKIISTKHTKPLYGDNANMKSLIGKNISITRIDSSLGREDYCIKAKGFMWSPKDIQQATPTPQPKGGTFNIDNLVTK